MQGFKLDRYAKERIISNPRHGEDIIKFYEDMLKEIDNNILRLEHQIAHLKTQFK